jgi:CHAT domain-containing protein/tetratricopeptide (TPR) repeat protein
MPPGDPDVEQAHYDLAMLLYRLGRFAEAEAHLRECVRRCEQFDPPRPRRQAERESDLAEMLRLQADYGGAETWLTRAKAAAESTGEDDVLYATILNNLAGIHRDLDDYAAAERLLLRALEISEKHAAEDPLRLATAELNLAELDRVQGKASQAERRYRRALELARRNLPEHDPRLVYHLNQLAVLYSEMGRYEDALPLRKEAAAIVGSQSTPQPILQAQILSDLGDDLTRQGHCKDAVDRYEQALGLREKAYGSSHPEVAATLTRIARAQLDLGNDAAAAAASRRAESILAAHPGSPEAAAQAASLAARVAWNEGRAQRAITGMFEAVDIVERLRPVRGGGDETRARYWARHVADFDDLTRWLLAEGRVGDAFEVTERGRARVLLDRLRGAGLDPRTSLPQDQRERLEPKEAEARLAVVQAQRALTRLRWSATLGDSSVEAALARARATLEEATLGYRTTVEEIELMSPRWQRVLESTRASLTADELRTRLVPAGRLLLSYHIGHAHSCVFVLPPVGGEVASFELTVLPGAARALGISSGPLRADDLRWIVTGRSPRRRGCTAGEATEGDHEGLARMLSESNVLRRKLQWDRLVLGLSALYDVLIPPPVEALLETADDVIVVPDGALHAVPFEVLVRTPGDERSTVYWVDTGPPVRYASSATTLARLQERERASRSSRVLSVSDPSYGPPSRSAARERGPGEGGSRTWTKLAPLPGTRLETRAIVDAMGNEDVDVLQGSRATELAFRRDVADARFVHIATHGLVKETDRSTFAALAFASPAAEDFGPQNDGFLHLFEVVDLDLECELAVLSACDTRRGETIEREGVFALSRGFLLAGAQRVIASLWSADDASTAELVGEVFRSIARTEREDGTFDAARILHDAKQTIRARPQWAAPYYWAPLVLSGVP